MNISQTAPISSRIQTPAARMVSTLGCTVRNLTAAITLRTFLSVTPMVGGILPWVALCALTATPSVARAQGSCTKTGCLPVSHKSISETATISSISKEEQRCDAKRVADSEGRSKSMSMMLLFALGIAGMWVVGLSSSFLSDVLVGLRDLITGSSPQERHALELLEAALAKVRQNGPTA